MIFLQVKHWRIEREKKEETIFQTTEIILLNLVGIIDYDYFSSQRCLTQANPL